MKLNLFSTFFLLIISLLSFGQSEIKPEIFLDENLNQLSSINYLNHQSCFLFRAVKIETDTLIINKIVENYRFDEFTVTEWNQVKHLLKRDLKIDINNKKNIIITFRDSLLGFKELKKSAQRNILIDHHYFNISERQFNRRIKNFDSNQKKCIKRIKQKNAKTLYTYSINNNFNKKTKHFQLKKISPSLKSLLFKNNDFGVIILKPNGQFFYYKWMSEAYVLEFLNEDWSNYIKDYNVAKSNLLPQRYGFFKKMVDFGSYNQRSFYNENESRKEFSQAMKNRNSRLPNNNIRVRNRFETKQYNNNESGCYSYVGY